MGSLLEILLAIDIRRYLIVYEIFDGLTHSSCIGSLTRLKKDALVKRNIFVQFLNNCNFAQTGVSWREIADLEVSMTSTLSLHSRSTSYIDVSIAWGGYGQSAACTLLYLPIPHFWEQ